MEKIFDASKHPTYKQQFDKLTVAYIENKVDPYDACACFIGNLLNGKDAWLRCRQGYTYEVSAFRLIVDDKAFSCIREESGGLYTPREIIDMEYNFLYTYGHFGKNENSLFEAFCSTLEMLKNIHISKGEDVELIGEFKKRELQIA